MAGGSSNIKMFVNVLQVKDIPKIVGENQQEIQMEGEMTILDTRLGNQYSSRHQIRQPLSC